MGDGGREGVGDAPCAFLTQQLPLCAHRCSERPVALGQPSHTSLSLLEHQGRSFCFLNLPALESGRSWLRSSFVSRGVGRAQRGLMLMLLRGSFRRVKCEQKAIAFRDGRARRCLPEGRAAASCLLHSSGL